jgi:hypothetical protein
MMSSETAKNIEMIGVLMTNLMNLKMKKKMSDQGSKG